MPQSMCYATRHFGPAEAEQSFASMQFRVAHVNVARGYRGGERQTELLIRELARHGVSQALVARRDEPLARRAAAAGVEVREVSGQLPGVVAALRGADIVHVHEGRSVYAAYVRSVLCSTPYVVTRRVDNPIKEHFLAHRAYVRAARVVAVAPQVAGIVVRYDARIRVEVIHSASSGLAVDARRAAAIRAAQPGKLLVGHVGALDCRQKAQDVIIEVARRLQGGHPQIHFVLVGGGADEATLKSAAAGLDNVTFTGFVDNVGDYLAAFDVFVLPSRKEGIGSILLDAMEQRLPIVASRVGGIPEIVHDGVNGLLIEPAQPGELEQAILSLCASPVRRRALGERGRARAKDYTAEAMGRKYLAIYASVLGTAAAP